MTPEEVVKQLEDELRDHLENQVVGAVEYGEAFVTLMERLESQVDFMNNATLEKKIEFMKTIFDKELPDLHDVTFSLGFEVENGLYVPVLKAEGKVRRIIEKVYITAKIASKDADES